MWFVKNPSFPERKPDQVVPDWVLARDYYAQKANGWSANDQGVDFEARGRCLFGFVEAQEKLDDSIKINADVNNNHTKPSTSKDAVK